jgi:hypothetical protein
VLCILLSVAVLGVLAWLPSTRPILRLQVREAVAGIATARIDVTNANPEDLHSDVWDVESLSRLQHLDPIARILRENRKDWRVQIAIAADQRSHAPYDELAVRRIIACYDRAVQLAPNRILGRSDLVLWLCGSRLHYVREEMAGAFQGLEACPLEASPDIIALTKQRLGELRRLEPRNALWPILEAYVHFGLHEDEEALADLDAAAVYQSSRPGNTMDDHLLYDSAIIAQVNEMRGLPSYEAKMAAIASQVFAHWPRVTNTLVLAGLLAQAKEKAGDPAGAARIYGDIVRISVLGRESADYALQADVMARAIEIPYRHALAAVGSGGAHASGPDELARAQRAAVLYFDGLGRADLASLARNQLEAAHELSYAIRMGTGSHGKRGWAAWNSSWFRPTAMWGGSVLLLGQAVVVAAIWLVAALIAWIRSAVRLPELLVPERATALSVLVVAVVPALSAPLVLLWNSWHMRVAWPASQTEVVALSGGWFLSFVGVCVLPLITLLVIAAVTAAWRRFRRIHLNVGFAGETLAILLQVLPYALVVTLLVYALSLIPLLEVRAQAEALVDHVLAHGEMSFLR